MSQELVVFDLDETLIAGDSAMIWHQYLVDNHLVTDPNFLAEDRRLMMLYAQGQLNMSEYLAFCMAPLRGMPTEEVDTLVAKCIQERIEPLVFPKAKQLLGELKAKGTDVLIISATMSFIVNQVSRMLEVEQALGIDLEIEHGSYTHQIKGIPSFRDGKVLRLKQWLQTEDKAFEHISFYTDSINDLAMCHFADSIHAVNPCAKLIAAAKENNWQVLRWTHPAD